jgi:hypothetical protein
LTDRQSKCNFDFDFDYEKDAQLKQLYKVIRDIEEMARYTPASVGESEQWLFIVSTAEENRQNFCKVFNGKNLFNALYGTYTVALHELKAVLKASTPADQYKTPMSSDTQEDGFKKVRRRKQHSTNESVPTSKRAAFSAVDTPPKEVATLNFFAPLRASDKDTDSTNTEATPREAAAPAKPGRPPPIVLTSAVNLILLQMQLKAVVSENFEFRSTRNGRSHHEKHGRFPVRQIPLRQPEPVLLLLLSQIRRSHKGGDTPLTAQHPCGRCF